MFVNHHQDHVFISLPNLSAACGACPIIAAIISSRLLGRMDISNPNSEGSNETVIGNRNTLEQIHMEPQKMDVWKIIFL